MIYPDFPLPEPVENGPTDLKDQLAKYSGQVPWSYLAPHCEKEALFFVDSSLDLKLVGTAFAEDQAANVQKWIEAGDIVKMGPLHAAQWNESTQEFEALLVSPFVLCRPAPSAR